MMLIELSHHDDGEIIFSVHKQGNIYVCKEPNRVGIIDEKDIGGILNSIRAILRFKSNAKYVIPEDETLPFHGNLGNIVIKYYQEYTGFIKIDLHSIKIHFPDNWKRLIHYQDFFGKLNNYHYLSFDTGNEETSR